MTNSTKAKVNVSIDVPDLNSGVEFYCSIFGWEEKSRPFEEMAVVDANNVTICFHSKAKGTKPTPLDQLRDYERHWTPVHLDIHVIDFEDTVERAKAAGACVEHIYLEPKPAAFCSDPFGNGFCIIEN